MRARVLAGNPGGCEGCVLSRCPGFRPLSAGERCRAAEQNGVVDGMPEQLLIEPTVNCNLDCPTLCGRSYPERMRCTSRRSIRTMPPELFQELVDRIDGPIPRIGLYNYGEPLLHSEFPGMCRRLRVRCPASHLFTSTNGTRLAISELRARLLESGLDEIIVSVDGATQPTYAAYRRGGVLATVLEGIRRLRIERDRAGLARPRIVWRYILFAWNDSDEELARAEGLAREIGVDRFCYHLSAIRCLASRRYRPGTPAFEGIRQLMF
jgi:MoaA/NifB/PqqE/SkfB family radical SAM enzyme